MEAACKTDASRGKAPTLELSHVKQLPESTNCLACSDDGRYLGLGHSTGLSVWCASSFTCVAERLQDGLEITSIQMTRIAETTYLLGTVDNMGVARVFAYHREGLHLLSVINVMENINKRSICLTFELSEGGDYGATSISCNGAHWLEVHHFPSESWLKELEMHQSPKQDSSEDVNVRWSPVAVLIKIRPPTIPAGLSDPLDFLQMMDFTRCSVRDKDTSSGGQCKEQVSNADTRITTDTSESPRCCTHHFLLPCGPFPVDSKAKSQPALPVAVCVWWSGTHNLLHYFLKNKADVEPVPDLLWPHTKKILCSAVSRCTCYVAVGLSDGLVCVWDRQTGAPLSVVLVSATGGAFFRMQFVDCSPVSSGDSQAFNAAKVHLLLLCKSGAIHRVSTERGTPPCTLQLTESPKHSRDLPTASASVPFLQNLALVVQRNGKIILQDVLNKTTVCFLIPPATHLISSPCNPVYALNSKHQTMLIKGDQDPSCGTSSKEGSASQLFVLRFGECDITKQYIVSPLDPPQQQKPLSHVSPEESCDLYLKQRAQSVDERNKAITQTWRQLEETAAMVQQRHSRSAAS